MICHGKPEFKKITETGKSISLYVDEKVLKLSVHGNKNCADCHVDIIEIPHKKKIKKVICVICHYKGNPKGAPQTEIYIEYAQSVHGLAAAAGNPKAPVCQDCHGNHNIKSHDNPLSYVNKKKIPDTCGRCHLEAYRIYRESIHGEALMKNIKDAPSCTDCHGEHKIGQKGDTESTVYLTNIPRTCSKCHGAKGIVGKYGIKTEQVTTYERSFHGVAIKFGAKTVASCASCHGVHDIRGADDPKSMVYINNIPKTCGKCHPGANINYARGKIHVDPTKKEAGIIFYVSFFFKWLTIMTMIGLITHIGLDLFRKAKEKRRIARG